MRSNLQNKDVKGTGLIRNAKVALSPVAGEMKLATGTLIDTPVALSIPVARAGNNLDGQSTAFGITASGTPVTATLSITRTDGAILEKSINVTSQITDAPDYRNITIILDNIEIPPPDQEPPQGGDIGGAGIDVNVDGWHVIYIDLTT